MFCLYAKSCFCLNNTPPPQRPTWAVRSSRYRRCSHSGNAYVLCMIMSRHNDGQDRNSGFEILRCSILTQPSAGGRPVWTFPHEIPLTFRIREHKGRIDLMSEKTVLGICRCHEHINLTRFPKPCFHMSARVPSKAYHHSNYSREVVEYSQHSISEL